MVDISDDFNSPKIRVGAIKKNPKMLKFVPDYLKTKTMYKKCVIKLLIITLMHYDLSMIVVRHKNCVIKLSIFILPQYNLFLSAIGLKKCAVKLLIDAFFCFLCDRFVSEDPFLNLEESVMKIICKCANDCLVALKFISDWFVTSKMFEKFHSALLANDDIIFFNEDFNKVTFSAKQIHILAKDIDKINLD